MGKRLTITITDRPPVSIDCEVWVLLAEAGDHDGQFECQANRLWKLKVRQCQRDDDDRCIVYGTYTTQWQGESDLRAGEIVEGISDVPASCHRVAERCRMDERIANECIADLPADEI